MTKKDYIKLAKAIKDNTLTDTNGVSFISSTDGFIGELCDILQEDNPRFDRERFLTACK